MRLYTLSLGLFLSLMLSCVVPFATPPIKATFEPGVYLGPTLRKVATEAGAAVKEYDMLPHLGGRFTVHPLGLFPSLLDGPLDGGVGWRVAGILNQSEDGALLEHGPCIELGVPVWQRAWKGGMLRLSLLAQGDLIFLPATSVSLEGGGALAGLSFELAGFTDGPFHMVGEKGALVGYAYGEFAIGASVMGGYHRLGGEDIWMVTGGLILRLPAAAGIGVALVPLF